MTLSPNFNNKDRVVRIILLGTRLIWHLPSGEVLIKHHPGKLIIPTTNELKDKLAEFVEVELTYDYLYATQVQDRIVDYFVIGNALVLGAN